MRLWRWSGRQQRVYDLDTQTTPFRVVATIQRDVLPRIQYLDMTSQLSGVVKDKGDGHLAHAIDDVATELMYLALDDARFVGLLFSEERGWENRGEASDSIMVCDPYCNTSLTFRSFRDAAVAACLTDIDGKFLSCAIADLQIRRIAHADLTGAYLSYEQASGEWTSSALQVSSTPSLDQAFVVMSMLKRKRRQQFQLEDVFRRAELVHGVDGAIMLLRMAAGDIDAYIDSHGGQPLY